MALTDFFKYQGLIIFTLNACTRTYFRHSSCKLRRKCKNGFCASWPLNIQTTLDLYVHQNYDKLKTVIDMLSNANEGVNSYKMATTTKIHSKHMV
jgi:hypothetical protein